MFSKAMRAVLCLGLLSALGACSTYTTEKIAPNNLRFSDGRSNRGIMVGITKTDGQEVRFDKGARVRSDTLTAVVGGVPATYALKEISTIWVYRRDRNKEMARGMMIGGGMLALGLLVGAILTQIT
jgi:hypothetical protein